MNEPEKYDEDYYLRGVQTGKSLYEDYRWMPDLTVPMARRIVDYLGVQKGETILDFGCARGYLVRALRELGHVAYGTDVSRWAVENCDEAVKPYVSRLWEAGTMTPFDWIIAKDVLEHIEYIALTVRELLNSVNKGVFVVVPLARFGSNDKYVIEEYERDVTHVQRHNLLTWAGMFMRPGWRVEASYRVRGIKDNWYRPGWEDGNGFLTVRRIEG